MKSINLEIGQAIRIETPNRKGVIVGVSGPADKPETYFYFTDDSKGELHTSLVGKVEYSDHDFIWGTAVKQ